MTSERRSRFKDNVRAGMRKHEGAPGSAPVEGEQAPVNPPEAAGRKDTAKKAAVKSPSAAEKKPVEEGRGAKAETTTKPARKTAKRKGRATESDPFSKREVRETKTRRVNLLLKESDYAAWTKAAKERGVSFTVFVETVVNTYLGR